MYVRLWNGRILFLLNFIWLFPLLQLNIAEIFGDNADFSELSECNANLHINKMVQKAYFGIDELGTMGTKGGFRSGSEYLMSVFYLFLNATSINDI